MKPFTALALALFLSLQLHSQESYESNRISKMPFANLGILDSVVGGYKVFLTGENHNFIAENSNIKLQMLKYLNRQAGVTNLIIELGFSRGYMLNQYINDDTTYYDALKYTTAPAFLAMYRRLRVFNQSLPVADRITVHGVDVERFADDAPILLARLLPKGRKVPEALEFQVEVIRTYGAFAASRYKSYYDEPKDNGSSYDYGKSYKGFYDDKVIDTMIRDYTRDRALFMSYLGDSFTLFDKTFTSIMELRKYEGYEGMPHQYVYRERKLYDNITALIRARPGEKFYGQFGRCHVSQATLTQDCDWWDFSATAKRLNEGSAMDSVLSIAIFYKDRKPAYYGTTYFSDENTLEELDKYIKIPCNDSNVLVRVNRKDTNVSKYYQYVLVNNTCGEKIKKYKGPYDLDDLHEWVVALDFGYGMANYNFSNLNSAIGNSPFSQAMNMYAFGWSYCDFGLYTGMNMKALLKQQFHSGSFNYSLSGYSIVQNFGGMISVSRRLGIGVYTSFGFSRLALNSWKDSSGAAFINGFSGVEQMKYVNNGFIAGLGIDVRFALTSFIDVFAKANYVYDFSGRRWRESSQYRNITLLNSPRTSVGYTAFNAGLSILLQE